MIFGNRRITADICVRINKEKINRENYTQFLGVVIDDKLNWKSYNLSIRSKLSKCCAIMYRASSLINQHGMHILYYSLSCLILCIVLKYGVTHMLQIFIV